MEALSNIAYPIYAGINALYLVNKKDVERLPRLNASGEYYEDLVVKSGADIQEIKFLRSSCETKTKVKKKSNGPLYEYTTEFSVPAIRTDAINVLEPAVYNKYLYAEQHLINGKWRLIGDVAFGATIEFTEETGPSPGKFNGYKVTITSIQKKPARYFVIIEKTYLITENGERLTTEDYSRITI